MDATGLRRAWDEFFAARQHTLVPSASLIPTHPTAPMFTNSGMMQFVPVFLGEEPATYDPPRAATIQKCVRAGGKHNDLDAIGRTPRHLSFFEMLGNFSFGDYFKAEAIPWAWELVTDVLGLDGDRMWITVHVSDDEAEDLWADAVGIPRDRIQRLDKDNFWEMGDTGPCGPSSEIFWDYGADFGPDGGPANLAAENRYVEIWNLVFPQYLRGRDGSLTDLPKPGIDTGAGLERMLTAINGTHTVYDVDPLNRLVDVAQSITGKRLGTDEPTDVALKILADHSRTMTFLVADGIVPSNEDRGYVLRRIIRRAVRYGYLLGVEGDLSSRLIGAVVDAMADGYPELRSDQDRIVGVISREEERFRQTLKRGTTLLDTKLAELREGEALGGDVAFDLYETYGFPLEVTQEITGELGIEVDEAGYREALGRAQQVSKAGAKAGKDLYANLTSFQELLDRHGPTEFVGREEAEAKGTVLAAVPGDDDTVSVFLDRTPFYAESGGQVGDTGTIVTDTGRGEVLDTTYGLPGLHRHQVRIVEGTIEPGQEATAAIDVDRRNAIRRNHTGTHVLHWALRKVLGDSVQQQGSLVDADRLRFDFGPADALTPDAGPRDRGPRQRGDPRQRVGPPLRDHQGRGVLARRDRVLRRQVRRHRPRARSRPALDRAVRWHPRPGPRRHRPGEDRVASPRSGRTCVGSRRSPAPGPSSASAPRRRCWPSWPASSTSRSARWWTAPASGSTRSRRCAKRSRRSSARPRAVRPSALAGQAVDGVLVARVDGVERDSLRDMAVALRDQGLKAVVLGTAPEGGGAAIVAAVTPESGLHASALLDDAKALIKGGGGKDPLLAVAGGKDADGLDAALDTVRAAAGLPAAS